MWVPFDFISKLRLFLPWKEALKLTLGKVTLLKKQHLASEWSFIHPAKTENSLAALKAFKQQQMSEQTVLHLLLLI